MSKKVSPESFWTCNLSHYSFMTRWNEDLMSQDQSVKRGATVLVSAVGLSGGDHIITFLDSFSSFQEYFKLSAGHATILHCFQWIILLPPTSSFSMDHFICLFLFLRPIPPGVTVVRANWLFGVFKSPKTANKSLYILNCIGVGGTVLCLKKNRILSMIIEEHINSTANLNKGTFPHLETLFIRVCFTMISFCPWKGPRKAWC